MKELFDNAFKGKTVLVTGHTGFKGSWLSIWLKQLGANVIGYALEPYTENDQCYVRFYRIAHVKQKLEPIYDNHIELYKKLELKCF